MCMKKYNAQKIILTNLQRFELHKLYMVNSGYFVKSTPPRGFSISFVHYRHVEDMHEEV